MFGFLSNLISGGIVGSVERLASEAIETDKESAEAKALFVKTLDPNGLMRRDLSRTASRLYVFYMVATTLLIFAQAYGLGDAEAAKQATASMTDLFVPLTTAWGGIVGASFGINGINSMKQKNND